MVHIFLMMLVKQQGMNDDLINLDYSYNFKSHLQGMFYRTIKMLVNGLKPAFVFDGKPPTLKSGEVWSSFIHFILRSFVY